MSFGHEEEELDWGDAVDVVSLGDDDEIPCIPTVEENIGEAGIHEDLESNVMKSAPAVSSHALGLSHLPPKPQSVLHHRRSRETIKASSMSRTYPRSPGSEDLPRLWEVRRTETVVYYYHTEHGCSQLKRPTHNDARLDKFHWTGDVPPSQPRNPPSGPAEWPERSDRSHDKEPELAPRAMSPSSMLLPRRGASPARGLAKPSKRSDPGSSEQETRNRSGWEQRGRANTRERSTRADHYSPPPEDSPPRRGSRHRSISPPRKPAMRSDIIINQHSRRSLSPRDREDARGYDRPFDRMPNDARYSREYPIELRRAGEYHDPQDHFRNNARVPNQYPPAEPAQEPTFPPEDTGYAPAKFREGRFPRPENRRTQSSRSNIRPPRVEPQEDDPRVSPVALRNEVPLPRHEFMPPREGASSHRRSRNGTIRDGRMMPEERPMVLPPDDGPAHVEHELQDDHSRRHAHRHSISGEEYMRHSISPQATRERRLPVSPSRHSYSGRGEIPQEPEREPEFRREGERYPKERGHEYPPKERNHEYPPKERSHESYPRVRQEDPIPHVYEPSVPHPRRAQTERVYPEPQPSGHSRRFEPFTERRWERDDPAQDKPQDRRREAVSDTEYAEPRSRRAKPDEGRSGFKRREGSPYEQWPPRDAHPAQMEVDAPVPNEKELSGWADFRRRRERSQERREPFRRARDSWQPNEEPQGEVVEGGKRQRVEGGTRMTQSFNREEDLPRKVPHHSPVQRPRVHSPTNSFPKLPPPAGAVDFQAAVTRAKDVANQLTRADPHKPRPKSRFDQPDPTPATEREINRGLLVPNSSSSFRGESGGFGANASGGFAANNSSGFGANTSSGFGANTSTGFGANTSNNFGANTSETAVSPDANERSSPEEVNGRQGSEGSHSSHLASRMDEASLRDNGYPQRHAGRNRQDPGSNRRDRNRSENHRNGGRDKSSRFGDFYRPDDTGRAGGMRAWGNPELERDPPPHATTYHPDRTYPPPPQIITSLPPRPPSPVEFRNRGRSPSGQVRSFDPEGADATEPEIDQTPTPGFSFRQASASAGSPRKYSLLDRMTDPTSGAPLTVPPKDRASNNNHHGNNHGNGQNLRRSRPNRTHSRR